MYPVCILVQVAPYDLLRISLNLRNELARTSRGAYYIERRTSDW